MGNNNKGEKCFDQDVQERVLEQGRVTFIHCIRRNAREMDDVRM